MNEAKNGLNGHASNGMKGVLLDAKAEQQAAQVMDAIRAHLPNLAGKSKEKVIQGITNFLENELKLTNVKVNVADYPDEMRIAPQFSLNGSTTEVPGIIPMSKSKIAVAMKAAIYG